MRWWFLLLGLATTAHAADWPQFLGPTRTGVSTETGLVDGWKAGPRELWRSPIGAGYASVAVAGGVVYAMASSATESQLVALDGATGRERWRSSLGPFYEDTMDFDGSRATPSVAGDRVVALSGAGLLVAVDRATGKRLWAVDLVAKLGGARPQWGYSGSPLVVDGRVYVSVGGTSGLVALSLADGEVLWKRPGYAAAGYSSPVRATLAGQDQIVFFAGTHVVGVKPGDGAVLWSHPWDTDYDVNAATPLVVGSNRIYVASGYGVGGAMLLVDPAGRASELWRTKKAKNKTATSVLKDGVLYGFNEDRLNAVDAKTGEERWTAEGYGRGTLVYGDGALFVLTEDCRVGAVKASPSAYEPIGTPRRYLQEKTECWAAPALADGVLYVRDNRELVAIELRSFGPSVP